MPTKTSFKKGHKRSIESIEKQRNTIKKKIADGKWRDMKELQMLSNTPEANAKKSHKGSSHPLWIEDRNKVKHRPRYEMTKWTKAVFKRDNFTCQDCGQRGGRLQADHIKPYASYPKLRWKLNNCITLCVECHKLTPTYGRRAIQYTIQI